MSLKLINNLFQFTGKLPITIASDYSPGYWNCDNNYCYMVFINYSLYGVYWIWSCCIYFWQRNSR